MILIKAITPVTKTPTQHKHSKQNQHNKETYKPHRNNDYNTNNNTNKQ